MRANRSCLSGLLIAATACGLACGAGPSRPAWDARRALQVAPTTHPGPGGAFLAKVERQLDTPWNSGVRRLAAQLRPPQHPVNNPHLAAAVSVELAPGERPRVRLLRGSGFHPFDNTALRLMSRVHWPPAPPALRYKRLRVVWHFFRDARGCSSRYARLEPRDIPLVMAFRAALDRRDRDRAWSLLSRHRGDRRLLSMLVQRGLAAEAEATRLAALPFAAPDQLVRILGDFCEPEAIWQAARATLERRRAWTQISQAIATLVRPLYDWRPDPALRRARAPRRARALMKLLARHGRSLPARIVRQAMSSTSAVVGRAAIPLSKDPTRVYRALRRSRLLTSDFGLQQAARLEHATPRAAATRWARRLLAVALLKLPPVRRARLVEALVRWPVAACAPGLAKLLATSRSPRERQRLLAAYGPVAASLLPLLRIVRRSDDLALKRAAIEALGRSSRAGLGVGYRVAEIGYRGEAALRGPAIIALARIAHPRFAKDLAYLVARQSAASKLALVPQLRATKSWPVLLKALRRGKTSPQLLARLRATKRQATAAPAPRLVQPDAARLRQLLIALTSPSRAGARPATTSLARRRRLRSR
jgi:hypothetical protein